MNNFPLPPASMWPSDGRFGAGPSLIRPAQVQALARASELGTSHRKPPVKARVASIKAGLSELFSLPGGYEIALGNGGASVFWPLAAVSLIREQARFGTFGSFSKKFAKNAASAPWLQVSTDEAPTGSVAIVQEDGSDAYGYPHNETSTGVTSPIYRVGANEAGGSAGAGGSAVGGSTADSPDGALTLVDATSIAGALEVDLSLVDAYYFSPQKVFGADGGLWFAILSPAAIERSAELTARTDRFVPEVLNLTAALEMSRKDNTVNTPAVATLVLMDEQIQWMLNQGGLPAMAAKALAGAQLVQEWAESRSFARPFVENPEWRSPVVTTVDLDERIDAAALAAGLREAKIYDIEGYRGLGRNQLRVASFPSIETSDIEALLACLDYAIERL